MPDPEAASESWASPRTLAAMREAAGLAQSCAAKVPGEDDVPGYRLGAELGRGAQGVVYAGVHRKTGRAVAIKIARGGTLLAARATSDPGGRLAHEVQVLARLQHPHLVAVFDTGLTAAGLPYFVMDRVDGRRVDAFALECGRDVRTLCGVFAKFANAIHRAHLAGVVHRDLKPSNLQVDDAGEPRVLDFGLARIENVVCSEDQRPGIIGSLPWLSPEQAVGDPAAVDLRTDVYSLGLVMFDALCGALPFDTTGDLTTTLATIRARGAVSLRVYRSDCDFEIDSIVARCIAVEPNQRYDSAAELARDLERYQRGEPLPHLAESRRGYVLHKTLRRHRVPFVFASIAVVVVAASAVVSFAMWRSAENESAELRRSLARNQVLVAAHALELDNVGRARELLAQIPPDLRGWEWQQLRWCCDRSRLAGRLDPAASLVAASSDGSRLAFATATGEIVSLAVDEGRILSRRAVHRGRIVGLAFVPGTMTVLSAGVDGVVSSWDLDAASSPLTIAQFESPIAAFALRPSGDLVAVVTTSRAAGGGTDARIDELHVVAVAASDLDRPAARVRNSIRTTGVVSGLAWTSDGAAIGVGEPSGVQLRDRESLQSVRVLAEILRAECLAFSHDGRRFAATSADGVLRMFDLATGRPLWEHKPHGNWIYAIEFAPDDVGLLSAGSDSTIKVWDIDAPRVRTTLRGHVAQVFDATYCDGGTIAACDEHGEWRVFATDTTAVDAVYRGHVGQIWNLAFAPDGRRIATVGADRSLRVWDAATPRVAPRIARFSQPCTALAYSASAIVCAEDDGTLSGFIDGGLVRSWSERHFAARPLALDATADGRHGVAIAVDGDARMFELQTGKAVSRWRVGGGVLALAIAPDAQRIAIALADGRLVVSALPGGEVVFDQRVHTRQVFDVAWHPTDPDCLATASFDGDARLTDLRTAACRAVMRGHRNGVRCVAFHPRGDRIATGGWDGTVRIWDTTDGGLVLTLDGHDDRVDGVAFDATGRRLASVSLDGTLRVWDSERDED